MLTNPDVISSPEVDSAFLTERVIAWEAAARSTMMPLRIPSEGSIPTPRMRMDLSSSTRPTSVHTLVVPTSIPTTISSISTFCDLSLSVTFPYLLTQPVIRRGRVHHINQSGLNASLSQRIHHRFIDAYFQFNIISIR